MKDAIVAFLIRPWMPAILSGVIVVATFAMYGYLIIHGNPSGLDDIIVGRILGTLDTSFGVVLAYWLGTSKSSHDKDQTIAAIGGKREEWTPAQRKGTK